MTQQGEGFSTEQFIAGFTKHLNDLISKSSGVGGAGGEKIKIFYKYHILQYLKRFYDDFKIEDSEETLGRFLAHQYKTTGFSAQGIMETLRIRYMNSLLRRLFLAPRIGIKDT